MLLLSRLLVLDGTMERVVERHKTSMEEKALLWLEATVAHGIAHPFRGNTPRVGGF